jgi:hypothetical protein
VQVRERREDEPALGVARVRHLEPRASMDAALVEDDVEVDGARAEAAPALGAAEVALDALQDVQELDRVRRRRGVVHAHDHRGVEERGLVRDVRGRGLVQARVALDDDARVRERPERRAEELDAVALVAPDRDDRGRASDAEVRAPRAVRRGAGAGTALGGGGGGGGGARVPVAAVRGNRAREQATRPRREPREHRGRARGVATGATRPTSARAPARPGERRGEEEGSIELLNSATTRRHFVC